MTYLGTLIIHLCIMTSLVVKLFNFKSELFKLNNINTLKVELSDVKFIQLWYY